MRSRKAGGESGENPELSRSCMGSHVIGIPSQGNGETRN
mgnify:CR=1 FL=1